MNAAVTGAAPDMAGTSATTVAPIAAGLAALTPAQQQAQRSHYDCVRHPLEVLLIIRAVATFKNLHVAVHCWAVVSTWKRLDAEDRGAAACFSAANFEQGT